MMDDKLPCPYDPKEAHRAVGMHHCPVCGEMVIAGVPHPDYTMPYPTEEDTP